MIKQSMAYVVMFVLAAVGFGLFQADVVSKFAAAAIGLVGVAFTVVNMSVDAAKEKANS